jgi:hypothetical protein
MSLLPLALTAHFVKRFLMFLMFFKAQAIRGSYPVVAGDLAPMSKLERSEDTCR